MEILELQEDVPTLLYHLEGLSHLILETEFRSELLSSKF